MVKANRPHYSDYTYIIQQLNLGFSACKTETGGLNGGFGIYVWAVEVGLTDETDALI